MNIGYVPFPVKPAAWTPAPVLDAWTAPLPSILLAGSAQGVTD